MNGGSRPVPQRLVIVVPTTAEFDSRSHRIATTIAGRGHEVTILARSAEGLPKEEVLPAGYRVIRVAVDPLRGLPGAASLRSIARRVSGPRPTAGSVDAPGGAHPPGNEPRGARLPASRAGRAIDGALRLLRIALTVRAQIVASRPVAPAADLYHGMAYLGLPVALDLGSRTGAPVVYDARDIYLEARNLARMPRPARALFAWLERRWARRASRVVTVNDAYADELAGRLGVERPLVVMNCPSRDEAPRIRARRFHQRLGLPDSARVVLYHGGLTEERGIEELVAALPSLHPAAHLVLMGYGPLRDTLVERAGEPATGGRLHVLPAVPPAELLDWVAAADVAAMPIQPTTLNHRLTTPNKLFEAMAAGVPIVAADLPGMAAIVTATGCGVVCDPTNVADLARAINALLDLDAATLEGYRRRALAAVADRYHWEHQAETLLAAYTRLTGRPW